MFNPDLGSEFLHPGSRVKKIPEFNYLYFKKLFLSSRKNDLGCSSRIPVLDFFPSRIPNVDFFLSRIPDSDPGSRGQKKLEKAPDPGFGSATLLSSF
jgi:hypothetical protein